MNAALLLSAILIMAAVTALINTITSHWKSLRKTLSSCRLPSCIQQAESYSDWGGWGVGGLRGCNFVVHHCPCLMEAWLFLSSCCDNAKCCFYECAKRDPTNPTAHCQHLPSPLDNQTVQRGIMETHNEG